MKYQIINNFLTSEECAQLITMSKSKLEPSKSLDKVTGEERVSEERKSNQMYFALLANPLIASIEKRISRLTNTPIENGENMQVVYYEPGGYFYSHFDDFDTYEGANPLDEGGHRILTFMIYLNDVNEGGETYFPKINLSVQPQMGKAFWWHNLLPNGDRDIETQHMARPTSTDKWICTKWVRQDVAL